MVQWSESIPIVQPTRCTCYLKLFILVKCPACFGRSFRPSSEAPNCTYSNGICQTAAATCCLSNSCCYLLAAGSSSYLTYTVAVYAVLSSWWWTERLSETCRAFYKNKSFEIAGASCWLYYRNILRCTDLWILNKTEVKVSWMWQLLWSQTGEWKETVNSHLLQARKCQFCHSDVFLVRIVKKWDICLF